MDSRGLAGIVCLLALAATAGCLGGGSPGPEPRAADAVPSAGTALPGSEAAAATDPASPGVAPDGAATTDRPTASARASRYAALRPTCDRPPGLVIHLQVSALANAPTGEGIRTLWRFTAPTKRATAGPYPEFERTIREQYRPLLAAEVVSYRRLLRGEDTAIREVTVRTGEGGVETYVWTVGRQAGGQYDGCWMMRRVNRYVSDR